MRYLVVEKRKNYKSIWAKVITYYFIDTVSNTIDDRKGDFKFERVNNEYSFLYYIKKKKRKCLGKIVFESDDKYEAEKEFSNELDLLYATINRKKIDLRDKLSKIMPIIAICSIIILLIFIALILLIKN